MMAVFKILAICTILFTIIILNTSALIMCPEDFCANTTCTNVTSCPKGETFGTTVCGCCNTCITEIPKGEPCPKIPIIGVPPTWKCEAGTICRNGICS
ncbi:uncharacterized protein [Euwallacea similis]|uniref:uncharacterized protein n=1 Tax=Euwallacea similis TaxID=1736056 RepID=UPI00344BB329